MSAENIRQDIERILKEIIAHYGERFIQYAYMLYCKIDGRIEIEDIGTICRHKVTLYKDLPKCILNELKKKMREWAIDNPDFVIYVADNETIDVDYKVNICINNLGLDPISLISPLIPDSLEPRRVTNVFKYVFDKDPLTQVFDYKLASSDHSYVCPRIYNVSYLNGNLGYLSMASAKRGVVAYCTILGDYIYSIVDGQWGILNKKLRSIFSRVEKKLEDYKKLVSTSSEDERKKYCDVYYIKDLVSTEIEEVDNVIKKYGIVRVAFPLD